MPTHNAGPDTTAKRTIRMPFVFGAADTVISYTIEGRGHINNMVLAMPNFTNVVTGVVTLVNPDGDEIWRSPTYAKNDSYKRTGIDEPQVETIIATLTLSGVPGGTGGTAYITLYYEKR